MKKLFVILLALSLLFVLAFPTPAAPNSGNVSASYGGIIPPNGDRAVYGVEIVFGAMEFTYTAAASRWNPSTHAYERPSEPVWSSQTSTVVVKNYSNVPMPVRIAYTANEGFANISGSFGDNADFTLESAVGKTMATADYRSATLTLSGELVGDAATLASIGSITVSIFAAP